MEHRYEMGPCAGYAGWTNGDGWVDFYAADGAEIHRWDAATGLVTPRPS